MKHCKRGAWKSPSDCPRKCEVQIWDRWHKSFEDREKKGQMWRGKKTRTPITWTMPVWSRKLTKATAPWLRCEATQPQIHTLSPTCSSPSVPHKCERLVNSRTSETIPALPRCCCCCCWWETCWVSGSAAAEEDEELTTTTGRRARVRPCSTGKDLCKNVR